MGVSPLTYGSWSRLKKTRSGLAHVVLREDDVKRRDERQPACDLLVGDERFRQTRGGELMPRERRWDHEDLAVVKFITAPVFRLALQIGVAHPRFHDLHGRHCTSSLRDPCRRETARQSPDDSFTFARISTPACW
jgi:hypothetical protein